ncbi:Uncharacterized protein FWK35_00016831 [Aphis craccivora]|uniref:Uncharacterized protein n=1 Tax=Aphis craccivora TaxID=307492 RepID=A0A6G0ZLB1_APHCR|nr:Uncharacterized protein FWK35_00016831 [Aphis craccivora]
MLVSKINNNDEVNINLRKNPIQQVNEFCCIGIIDISYLELCIVYILYDVLRDMNNNAER